MEFEARLKGYVAETLIESILTDAGYRVIRAGLEKRILDNPLLKAANHDFIHLPEAIRRMPDFLVLGGDRPVLLEVKYRADWEGYRGDVAAKIARQLELFPSLRVVMCCGSGDEFKLARSHVGVIRPYLRGGLAHHTGKGFDRPISEMPWPQLFSLATEFPRLHDRASEGSIQMAARLLFDIEQAFSSRKGARTPTAGI